MENKLFACEMTGCFDSATQDKVLDGKTHQLCSDCAEWWESQHA
jgi:hypothetical protein